MTGTAPRHVKECDKMEVTEGVGHEEGKKERDANEKNPLGERKRKNPRKEAQFRS